MKIKFKKLTDKAVVPKYAKTGDAGLDLVATSRTSENGYIEYGTDLILEIPTGYVGLIYPRSSISKTELMLCNSVPVIDSGFRGEIKLRFKKAKYTVRNDITYTGCYNVGDKIGQLMIVPYPTIELEEVAELSKTERGVGGFGSSDGSNG